MILAMGLVEAIGLLQKTDIVGFIDSFSAIWWFFYEKRSEKVKITSAVIN